MIYRALQIFEQRGESGRRYTMFSDSVAAMGRIRTEKMGPDQDLAMATHEGGRRITGRNNSITTR